MSALAGVLEPVPCRRHPAEWWVGAGGRGVRDVLGFGLAAHICMSHCPIRRECEADALALPAFVAGVYAGVLYVGDGVRSQKQPAPRTAGCPECGSPTAGVGRSSVRHIEARLPLVRSMRKAGMTYAEIARVLECSKEGVRNACDRHGIKPGPRRVPRRIGVPNSRAWVGGRPA